MKSSGTIYAILLAFAVSGVWQNFSAAVASVQTEAAALLGLVHIVDAFPSEHTKKVHSVAVVYATEVIAEWQALAGVARGAVAPQDLSYEATMALIRAVQFLKPANARETAVFEQALVMLNNWLDARRKRLQSASGGSAAALWPLLMAGATRALRFPRSVCRQVNRSLGGAASGPLLGRGTGLLSHLLAGQPFYRQPLGACRPVPMGGHIVPTRKAAEPERTRGLMALAAILTRSQVPLGNAIARQAPAWRARPSQPSLETRKAVNHIFYAGIFSLPM